MYGLELYYFFFNFPINYFSSTSSQNYIQTYFYLYEKNRKDLPFLLKNKDMLLFFVKKLLIFCHIWKQLWSLTIILTKNKIIKDVYETSKLKKLVWEMQWIVSNFFIFSLFLRKNNNKVFSFLWKKIFLNKL